MLLSVLCAISFFLLVLLLPRGGVERARARHCAAEERPMDVVRALLEELTGRVQRAIGAKLLGLYLWGSYVVGDFDPRLSDLDLVAVLTTDLDEPEFAALRAMHD